MKISFQKNGNLIPGVHIMTIDEFESVFGFNEHRKKLIIGLKKGIEDLRNCGCRAIYIDGSFVSTKENPADFDACWETTDVDLKKLENHCPILIDFSDERKNQKLNYLGEFFPANAFASPFDIYLNFFQLDRDYKPKGIVRINLN